MHKSPTLLHGELFFFLFYVKSQRHKVRVDAHEPRIYINVYMLKLKYQYPVSILKTIESMMMMMMMKANTHR